MKTRAICVIAFCAVSWWNATPAASAEFYRLGDLSGGPFHSSPTDISSDGKVVVGNSAVDTYMYNGQERLVMEAFRWTIDSGMQPLGTLPGHKAEPGASHRTEV